MFASWTKARRATLVAASVATLVLIASPSAHALEGIQGRHAIFYPSLELVYQHDDNYYLTPSNEISASTVIAHAHFALEIPGTRQYLRMEYHPQFRSIDVSRGGAEPDIDSIQHFWNLDAKLRGSSVFSVDIHQDFSVGALEIFDLDDNREFIRNEEQFWAHKISADFIWEGSRQGAVLKVGHDDTSFDDLTKAPAWFELSQLRLGGEYFYKFTPLTRFLVGYGYRDATQDYTPDLQTATGIPSLDSSRNDLYFGFKGELGRTTTGNAKVGFVSQDYDAIATSAGSYDGVTAHADVTKSFSRYTKLIFAVDRDVNFSGFATGPDQNNLYYTSNRAGVTFTQQPQGGRVGWTLAGAFQRNGYDIATADVVNAIHEREDDITDLRAEVGFHPLEHLSLRLNYRYQERDSNDSQFDYTDNLVIFQVQFGF